MLLPLAIMKGPTRSGTNHAA